MFRAIGAFTFILATTFAQTKDIDGWGKVKWGMTVEEARAIYRTEAQESTTVPGPNFSFVDRLTVPKVKIGDMDMEASLQTPRGSDQIRQVSLTLNSDIQAPSFVRRGAFEQLKGLVIEKYGAPANEDRTTDRRSVISTLVWSLPSTTITLIWSEDVKYQLGYVTLKYKAVDKKALEAL
jgi:hypothetical protein